MGDGVLTYKGKDYVFIFQAKWAFAGGEEGVTAAELSGQSRSEKPGDFNGNISREPSESVGIVVRMATIRIRTAWS